MWNKQSKRNRKLKIRVFGHEYSCAYIGCIHKPIIYVYILWAYVWMQEACAHRHTLNLNLEIQTQNKTWKLKSNNQTCLRSYNEENLS